MKKTIFLLGIAFIALQSFAQEEWSLEKCVKHALENNIQIKQQQLQTQINENNLKQSKNNILPNLNASVGENVNFGRNIDYGTNTYVNKTTYSSSVGISSGVSLFSGFEKHHQKKQSEFNLKASLEELEEIKNNVQLNIATAYLQILFNSEQVKTIKDQIETTKLQVDRTRIMVEAGKLPQGDLLDIQSQLAQEELNLVNNENALETAYLTLSQMLELPTSKGFQIILPDVKVENYKNVLTDVESSYQKASQQLPNIRKSEAQLEGVKKDLDIAKSNLYPSLSANIGFNTGYSSTILENPFDPNSAAKAFFDQLGNNYGTYIGLSLQIPIFNKFQVRTNMNNAKIRIEQSQYNLEVTKKNLYKDIQKAYADAAAALKKYYATEKSVEALKESFRYTQEKLNAGSLNSLDFNVAKKNLSNAESQMLQAKYEYVFKSNILNFYMGNPFTL